MKVGDRVVYIGFTKLKSMSCVIVECNIPNGHYNMYAIKSIDDGSVFEAWEDEIELDVEYYRDIKLNKLLNT